MKKVLPILAAALAAVALGSCGSKEKEYKKPTDTAPWLECLNKTLAAIGNTDLLPGPTGGGIIDPDVTPDKGGRVELTTKQLLSNGSTAEIEWDYEYDKAKVDYEFDSDGQHKILEFKHPAKNTTVDDYFNFTIKRIIIGEYALDNADLNTIYKQDLGDESENLNFTVTLKPYALTYENIKIADINKLNSAGDGYDAIDYTKESPYFRTIEDQAYRYCNVKGKVVYMAETMNWGIIADGNEYTEVYFGSDDASRAKYFPGLRVGKYVECRGNLGQYKGNFQFSFIERAHELTDHSMIAEPGTHKVYNGTEIAKLEIEGGKHEYVVPGMFNSLGQITGTYKAGSLKSGSTVVTEISTNQRYSFIMIVDGHEMNVSYDYHVGKNADGTDNFGILNQLKTVIAGGTHTIKGTMRYEGNDVSAKKGSGQGRWCVVPYLPTDVA